MSEISKLLRIFVAGPSDVADFKKDAFKAIQDMTEEAKSTGFDLEPFGQEAVPPAAFGAGEVAQDVVGKYPGFKDCSILVAILWRRLGTPTGKAPSGTAQEIQEAYERYRATGRPQLFIYFRQIDPFCLRSPCAEIEGLLAFKESLKKNLYFVEFSDSSELTTRLKRDLRQFLASQLPRRTLVAEWHLYSGTAEGLTEKGEFYEPPATARTYHRMREAARFERLLQEEPASSKSTEYADLYRLHRRLGEHEYALLCLEMAQNYRSRVQVDVLDDAGAPTGRRVYLREAYLGSLLHPICHIFVRIPKSKIYLQRRSMKKSINPGRWTSSACGPVRAGELPEEAARRELREDLGLIYSPQPIKAGTVRVTVCGEDDLVCNAIAHVFVVDIDTTILDVDVNVAEIAELKLFEPLAIGEMLDGRAQPILFADDFHSIFECFWNWLIAAQGGST